MIKLLVQNGFGNYVQLDLYGNEDLAVSVAAVDFSKVASPRGTRSFNFKLPITNNNKLILESLQLPTVRTSIPYRVISVKLFSNGIDMNTNVMIVESVDDTINVRIYGDNSNFFLPIKQLTLQDINLNDYNHYWDRATIRAAQTNTEGYTYPLVNWTESASNGYVYPDNIKGEVMFPMVFFDTILQRICSGVGYTLQDDISSRLDGRLVLSVVNSGFRRGGLPDNFYNVKVASLVDQSLVIGSGSGELFIFMPDIVSQDYNYYNSSNTGNAIRIGDVVRCELAVSIEVYNNEATNAVATLSAHNINDVPNGINTTVTIAPGSTQTITLNGFVNTSGELTDSGIQLTLSVVSVINPVDLIVLTGASVEIVSSEVLEYRTIYFENYLTLANNLPKIKQSDFLKAYCEMFNGLITVDESRKIVYISSLGDALLDTANAADWTDKLDYSQNDRIKFEFGSYGQANSFKYLPVDGETEPTGTTGIITISNQKLDLEKDIVELPFAYTNVTTGVGYTFPWIKFLDPAPADYTDIDPRVLLIKYDAAFSMDYGDRLGEATTTYLGWARAWFIEAGRLSNIGFADNLLTIFYPAMAGILQDARVVTRPIRLNDNDIIGLNFTRPVYFAQDGCFYFISEIKKYVFGSGKSTDVEFIKLT